MGTFLKIHLWKEKLKVKDLIQTVVLDRRAKH